MGEEAKHFVSKTTIYRYHHTCSDPGVWARQLVQGCPKWVTSYHKLRWESECKWLHLYFVGNEDSHELNVNCFFNLQMRSSAPQEGVCITEE